jgi:hypothetical protein
MYKITLNTRIIPNVVRDIRKVLKDSLCVFYTFPVALSSISAILLLIVALSPSAQTIKEEGSLSLSQIDRELHSLVVILYDCLIR